MTRKFAESMVDERNGVEPKVKPQPNVVSMNLVGYMLGQMMWHSDGLVETLLQQVLEKISPDTDSPDFDEEHMLVFKDLQNNMWQISKIDDISNFDELID